MMKPCKRCLLQGVSPEAFHLHILSYLQQIPKSKQTPSLLYNERLAQCRKCPSLQGGVCEYCGCFVELRAAHPQMGCPHPSARWLPIHECSE